MVKKVDGINNSSRTSATAIEATKQIQTTAVSGVTNVIAPTGSTKIDPIRRATRAMSSEEREYLIRLVNEEATRLFSNNSISQKQKETAKKAVNMAIDAAIIDDKK